MPLLKRLRNISLILHRCLRSKRHPSFNTWMLFSKLLRDEDLPTLKLFGYHQEIKTPLSSLETYTLPLTSHSFEFITSLTINTTFSVPELVKISNLTNLGVLEITHNPLAGALIPVSDRLIRAWHFAALNDDKFKVLRILKLWNHTDVTIESLSYLNSFPALALYEVSGCGFKSGAKSEAKLLGWRATKKTDVYTLLEAACVSRAMALQRILGKEFKALMRPGGPKSEHQLEIRKLPRSELAPFLAGLKSEPDVKQSKTNDTSSDEDVSDARSHGESMWTSDSPFTAYSRIGELRNDTDLVRAGLNVHESATLAGHELITPVAMASLSLGRPYTYGSANVSDLAFFRIKDPKDDPGFNTRHEPPAAENSKSNTDTTLPEKRRKVEVMKSKKKNIDDVLHSFR